MKDCQRQGSRNKDQLFDEADVIDLIVSDLKTNEDDDYNNEDDDDDFIDDKDDEYYDDRNYDDDTPNINNFYMEMRVDTTYSPGSRALCEWDPENCHEF